VNRLFDKYYYLFYNKNINALKYYKLGKK